jgi:hypothetical protein
LTEKPPLPTKNLVETIAAIRQADPVPLKKFQLSIPDNLQDAVLTMLAKRPEQRFQTPEDAARTLERVAKFQGVTLRESTPVAKIRPDRAFPRPWSPFGE